MKIIRDVSQEEMESQFPDVMAALSALNTSGDVDYCGSLAGCDGLRVMVTGEDGVRRCAACGEPHPQ